MSYHLHADSRVPLMITAIGLRIDAVPGSDLYEQSQVGALLVKQYLHHIAHQCGRGGHVDIVCDDPDAIETLKELGFRKGPRIKGVRMPGTPWRQDELLD